MKNKQRTAQWTLVICFLFAMVSMGVITNVCQAADPKEIVVGTPICRTGMAAPFGVWQEWGYTTVINDINKNGGIYMSKYKQKLPVKLVLYDDESRPEKATEVTERLVLKDKVHALLSTGNPMLVIPQAMIAEREGVPMSMAACPIQAFLKARKGWTWVWNIFFDELDMARQQMLTMNTVQSNRKIAVFTDNTPDGIIQGGLWKKNAPEMGYTIVSDSTSPSGTSEYSDAILRAKEGGADIVISQMRGPDSIALWKQIRALGYKPKAAFFEKGGEPLEWWLAHGQAAQGTMVSGFWHASLPYPGAQELRTRFEKYRGKTYSQHIADWYTACRILMDAIERAGTLDPKAIADEMAKTDKTYEVGPVKYNKDHYFALPAFMTQWQNGKNEIVYPAKLATAKLIYPLP
jgi:branched-chain amino acid transport system substrate-binding protein